MQEVGVQNQAIFRKVSGCHSCATALPAVRWPHTSAVRHRRRCQAEDVVKAARALSLVQMGEHFSARQALERATPRARESGHLVDSHRFIEETTNAKEGIK